MEAVETVDFADTAADCVADNPGNLIAVTDQMKATGCIAYVRTSGGIPLAELEAEWLKRGLPAELLPSGRTEKSALTRALQDVKRGARELIRPLEGSAGLALVDESASGDDLDYAVELRARIVYPPNADATVVVDPADHPRARALTESFTEHLTKLSNAKISQWVWGTLGGHVNTVSLRETGGVYFVPQPNMDTWNRMCAAISAVADVKFYGIPAMDSDDAVEAILDAVTAEADGIISTMQAELGAEGDKKLGTAALATREARSRACRDKVEEYEKLLGRKLTSLRDKIDGLDEDVSAAMLMAGDDD